MLRVPARSTSTRSYIYIYMQTPPAQPRSSARKLTSTATIFHRRNPNSWGARWWSLTKKTLLSPGVETVKIRFHALSLCGIHNLARMGSKMTARARKSAKCCIARLVNMVGGKQQPNARVVDPGTQETY